MPTAALIGNGYQRGVIRSLPPEKATSFRNINRLEHSGQGRAQHIGVWGGDMASSMDDVVGAASKREL